MISYQSFKKFQEMAEAWADLQHGFGSRAEVAWSPDGIWLCVIWDNQKMPHTFRAVGSLDADELKFELVCGTMTNFRLKRA